MKRERIFLALVALCGFSLLSACSDLGTKRVDVPKNILAITDPFILALKQGDAKKTEEYLSANHQGLPKIRFTEAQKILTTAPDLKPVFFRSKPKSMMGPTDNELTVVYAAKHKGRWKSIQIRLFALDGEPFEIENWRARDEQALPLELRTADLMNKTLLYGGGFLLALTGALIAGLIWFFRNRKKAIPADGRRVATVSQHLE